MTTADGARVRPAWVPDDLYPFEDRWAEIEEVMEPATDFAARSST